MLRLLLASVLLLAACDAAYPQNAYFSLEGLIPNTSGAAVDFNFNLSRSVSDPELFRFETDSWAGGLNAAGDVIPAFGFDAELELFNGGGTSLAMSNEIDDGGSGNGDFDALLSWASVPNLIGTPIPSPRPAGDYRLNLREFGSGFATDWAAELRGPADAMTFTGATGVNGGTVTSLKFGATAGGTATYRFISTPTNAGILTNPGTLVVQAGGVLLGNGANGTLTQNGRPGRAVTSSGTLGVEAGGGFELNGGDGFATAGLPTEGGRGGRVSISGGNASLAGVVNLLGGSGGTETSGSGFGGDGGEGGRLTVSGGVASLSGDFNLRGGVGGDVPGSGPAGRGGRGGDLVIAGGNTVFSGSLDLTGGQGGEKGGIGLGGNGGNGGTVTLSAGAMTLQSGSINLAGGQGGIGTEGNANNGANGSVNVSGGTLTLNAGALLGRSGVASADPLTLANADLNISGGSVVANNPITVSGNGADINLSGGTFTADTVREAAGGDLNLSGAGRLAINHFEGALSQTGGTLLSGSSAGITNVTGAYNLSGGALEIELFSGGASPMAGVDFDQLTAGSASLGGELQVLLDSEYTPMPGDLFPIITTTNGVSGSFAIESLPTLAGGLGIELRYGSHSVELLVTSAAAGDFNNDGVVDGFDFLSWQRGESPNPVSASDLANWETNFGVALPVANKLTAVPEPSCVALIVAGWLPVALRRKSR